MGEKTAKQSSKVVEALRRSDELHTKVGGQEKAGLKDIRAKLLRPRCSDKLRANIGQRWEPLSNPKH